MRPVRPPHRRVDLLALVLLGGATGTAVRVWATATFPPPEGGWPWVTFALNVVGSFLLGLLVSALRRSRLDTEQRLRVSLALGTGALGGLTTYSTFAVDVVLLARDGDPAGVGYGVLGVLAGLGAAALGYRAAR